MEYVFGAIAVIALILAIKNGGGGSGNSSDVEDVKKDARRRVENLREEFEARLELQNAFIAKLAAGESIDPAQIREGRLWRDASPPEGQTMVEAGSVHVIDVRSPQETAGGVIPGALLIPLDQLEQRLSEVPKGKPLLVACAAGGRSVSASEFLSAAGHKDVLNLVGGMGAWRGKVERPDA